MKEFNLNSTVKVKLNERGIEILKKEYEKLNWNFPNFNFKIPKTDEQGYTNFQLWRLFQTFGPYIGAGLPVPFEDNIIKIEDELLIDESNDIQKIKYR